MHHGYLLVLLTRLDDSRSLSLLALTVTVQRAPTTMMRNKHPMQSMQKTYDECYLICSTAVYFESRVCLISIPRDESKG